MFPWWISWACFWAWNWATLGVNANIRASSIHQSRPFQSRPWASSIHQSRPIQSSPIQSRPFQSIFPSHLEAQLMSTSLTLPSRPVTGKKGKVELGPGMGGSAIQPPEGREGHQFFATQPTTQTAVVGSTAVLPCRVINKVGHLQWTRDGFGLGTDRDLSGFSRYSMIGSDDEGDFSLRIQPVVVADDATYQCQVSAMADIPGIRSHRARLTVYVPPKHPRVRPAALSTTAGLSVTLECESAEGRPPAEIQWVDDSTRETLHTGITQSTQPMNDGKRVTVISRLTFTPNRKHHNSTITCQTSNQALTSPLTSSIQLSVLFPPEVKLDVYPASLTEGDDAKFICTAYANPPVISYRWYHKNRRLVKETSRVLILPKITRDMHQDAIACQVSNLVGTSKKSQNIQVHYGPVFRDDPSDVMAEMGKDVILKCDVDSNPPASVVWIRHGSDMIIGSGSEILLTVDSDTVGHYHCIASVRGFPDLKGAVRVLVKGPPTIISPPEQRGRKGDQISLDCTTLSIPSPIRITWTFNGREIDLADPRYEIQEEKEDEGVKNLLVIHKVDSADFGTYNCSVVNEYGVVTKQITLNLHTEEKVGFVVVVGILVGILVVLVAVIVTSFVLCNKRSDTIKGSAATEKNPSLTVVPGLPVNNQYCAPTETKISHYLDSNPAPSTTTRPLDQNEGDKRYTPFLQYTEQEYTPIPNGRRASTSNLGLFSDAPTNNTLHTPLGPLCILRRGSRGALLPGDLDLVRGTTIPGVFMSDCEFTGQRFSDMSGGYLKNFDIIENGSNIRENGDMATGIYPNGIQSDIGSDLCHENRNMATGVYPNDIGSELCHKNRDMATGIYPNAILSDIGSDLCHENRNMATGVYPNGILSDIDIEQTGVCHKNRDMAPGVFPNDIRSELCHKNSVMAENITSGVYSNAIVSDMPEICHKNNQNNQPNINNLENNQLINSSHINNQPIPSAITTSPLNNISITSTHLNNQSIPSAITSSHLNNQSITSPHLNNQSIPTSIIPTQSITSPHLNNQSIPTSKATSHPNNQSITSPHLNNQSIPSAITTSQLNNISITSPHLNNQSIPTSITSPHLNNQSIPSAITSSHLNNQSITSPHLNNQPTTINNHSITNIHKQNSTLLHNGTPPVSQSPSYTPVRNFASPPPPYTTKLGSPRAPVPPSRRGAPKLEGAFSEAKFIFSPEAMMKPGTHV